MEKLDKAIVRPGRFDIKIEVGYVNEEILGEFLDGFFPEESSQTKRKRKIKNNLTVAELQNLILSGASKSDVVKYCYA